MHLPGVPNVKADGYCGETRGVFDYLGYFCHGSCMPNRYKLIGNTEETLQNRYEEVIRCCKKSEMLGMILLGPEVASSENICGKMLALEMNSVRNPT